MSLEAKKFLDNKQEEHFKQFGVYADVNSKLAEWMQEYKDKQTIMNGLKKCTVSGVVDYEKNFYKEGKYPYATFVENFRAKHRIHVEELRTFCEKIEYMHKQSIFKKLRV